jgi:hypothetical protein
MTAFELPVPGQSLTTESKAAPYERPPEFSSLQDVVKLHLENLSTKEAVEDIVHFVKQGVDVKTLNEGILRSAVMEGLHNIDNSINVAPITHERIVGILNAAGIDFEEGFDNLLDERATKVARRITDIQGMINESGQTSPDDDEVDLEMLDDDASMPMPEEEVVPLEQQEIADVEPEQGLMSRRV